MSLALIAGISLPTMIAGPGGRRRNSALHPRSEVATPLRQALIPRGQYGALTSLIRRYGEQRAPARIAPEPHQRMREAGPIEPRG